MTAQYTGEFVPGWGGEYSSSIGDGSVFSSLSNNPIASSYLSSLLGIALPPNCTQDLPGGPIAQIPVEYLTSTSTVDNVPQLPVSAGDGARSTSPSVSQTTPAFPGSSLLPIIPTPTSRAPGNPESALHPSPSPFANPGAGQQLPPAVTPTTISLGGLPFLISGTQLIAGSQTLAPGGAPVMFGGTAVSLAPSATAIIIGDSTIPLAPAATPAPAEAITIGQSVYSLTAGGAMVVDGTTISLEPSGSTVVIGGSSYALSRAIEPSPQPVLTFGQSVYIENSASAFVIAGQTLTPGGVITVDGTTISLGSSASAVVVGGTTFALSPSAEPSLERLLTLGSVYTENSASDFLIEGQTLSPGGEITVDGTVVSLAPGGTVAVIDSSTKTVGIVSPVPVSSTALGGLIYSMFNGGEGSTTTPTPSANNGAGGLPFTGAAQRRELEQSGVIIMFAIGVFIFTVGFHLEFRQV